MSRAEHLIRNILRARPREEWLAIMRALMPALIERQEFLWDLIRARVEEEAPMIPSPAFQASPVVFDILKGLDLGFRLGRDEPIELTAWIRQSFGPEANAREVREALLVTRGNVF